MKRFIFLSFFIFASSSFAEFIIDDPPKPKQEVPVITGESGKQLVAVWKDGREATTVLRIVPKFDPVIPLQLYENGCNRFLASKCGFKVEAFAYQVHVKWTKHPDANKVGKTLMVKPKDFPEKFEIHPADTFLFTSDKVRSPKAAKNINGDHLICDNYKFLPTDPMQMPHARIVRWDTELMQQNPETGGNENRTVGGAYDIELVPDQMGLLISVLGGYTSNFPGGGGQLFAGDIIGLTLRGKDEKLCQIGMKPDISAVVPLFNEYIAKLPDTFEPYLIDQDENSKMIVSEVKRLLENPDSYPVE